MFTYLVHYLKCLALRRVKCDSHIKHLYLEYFYVIYNLWVRVTLTVHSATYSIITTVQKCVVHKDRNVTMKHNCEELLFLNRVQTFAPHPNDNTSQEKILPA